MLVSHSSAWKDFGQFVSSDVTVIGAGSSALELAAGLNEAGAKVRLVVRGPGIRFDGSTLRPDVLSVWRKDPPPKVGIGSELEVVALL